MKFKNNLELLLLIVSRIAVAISNWVIFSIAAHQLSVSEYSHFQSINSIAFSFGILACMSIPTIILTENLAISFKCLFQTFKVHLVIGFVLSAIGISFFEYQFNEWIMVFITLFFIVIGSLVDALFITRKMQSKWIVFQILISLISIIYVYYFTSTSLQILVILPLASLIKIGFIFYEDFNENDISSFNQKSNLSFRKNAIIFLNDNIQNLTKWMDKIWILISSSPHIFATYLNATIEVPFFGLFSSVYYQYKSSEYKIFVEKNDFAKLSAQIQNDILILALVYFPVIVGLKIFSNEFIQFLWGNNYANAVEIFEIAILVLPLRIINYSTILYTLQKHKFVLIGAILDIIVFFISFILFLYLFDNQTISAISAGVVSTYFQFIFYIIIIIVSKKIFFSNAFVLKITLLMLLNAIILIMNYYLKADTIIYILYFASITIQFLLSSYYFFKK